MEQKERYEHLMMAHELVIVTPDMKLQKGQLFGFKGLNSTDNITAAYPVYEQRGREILYVLFTRDNGQPCVDNDWIREDHNVMYTNSTPIIVDITTGAPTTFQNEIANIFKK